MGVPFTSPNSSVRSESVVTVQTERSHNGDGLAPLFGRLEPDEELVILFSNSKAAGRSLASMSSASQIPVGMVMRADSFSPVTFGLCARG